MSGDGGPPPVELEAARAVARDCGWSLAELASSYLRGTGRQLESLRAAVAAGDSSEVERLGHGGRGASLSCGVPGMAEIFDRIERQGRQASLGGVPELLDQAAVELERVAELLRAESATG